MVHIIISSPLFRLAVVLRASGPPSAGGACLAQDRTGSGHCGSLADRGQPLWRQLTLGLLPARRVCEGRGSDGSSSGTAFVGTRR